MNMLPDYIVLDFLDWLKLKSCSSEFLFNELIQDDYLLEQLARDYIEHNERKKINGKNQFKMQFKAIVQQFLNSEEFSICYDRRCEKFKNNTRYNDYCIACWRTYFECFEKFVLREFHFNINCADVSAYELALSAKYFLEKNILQDEKELFQLMTGTKKNDISIILDFVNWLKENEIKLDFSKIPEARILLYLNDYENVINRKIDSRLKKNITKSLVNKNPKQLVKWLQKVFGGDEVRSLSNTIKRYMKDIAKFKCLLMPIKSESKFNDFIKNYWDDLDLASANFLDIFYCEKELKQSGYKTLSNFRELKIDIDMLPCIVIWKDNISKYEIIGIRKLNNSDIFALFQKIIKLIREGKNLNEIVNQANKEVYKMIEDNKSIVKNEYNFNQFQDSASVQIIHDNHGKIINQYKNVISQEDINKAKEVVEKLLELETSQKEFLNKLLDEYKESVNTNNKQKQKKCRERWQNFKAGLGKTALTVINALGSVASIASLFIL